MIRRNGLSLVDLVTRRASEEYVEGYLKAIEDAQRYGRINPNLSEVDVSQVIHDFHFDMSSEKGPEWVEGYIAGWEDYSSPEGRAPYITKKINSIEPLVDEERTTIDQDRIILATIDGTLETAENVEKIATLLGFKSVLKSKESNPDTSSGNENYEDYWVEINF